MAKYFHEREVLTGSATSNSVINQNNIETTGPIDIALYFSPFIDISNTADSDFASEVGSLSIPTGADEILWNYGVNTKRTPTYGGEVVQILSMFADKMAIKGTCQNYIQQRNIYEYFKNYIGFTTGASGLERQQKYLVFRYPARAWSFIIMVTNVEGMRMATQQAAPEWRITAEIVSENDRYALGEKRTDRYADVLSVPIANAKKTITPTGKKGPATRNIGINKDPFGDLMGYMNGGRGKVAENFEAMIASWVTGDIATIRTNPLSDPEKSADEIYKEFFGSEYVFGTGSGSGDGGGTLGSGEDASSPLSGTVEAVLIAALAANAFKAVGLTASKELLVDAVKVAYGESGWDTRSINYNGTGGQEDYNTYISGDATKAPTSSSGGSAASYDLGLWQINNYWHPNEIRVACGENVSPISPQAGSDAWKSSVQVNITNGNHVKMLDNAFANAKAMAVIYKNNKSWGSWVAYGKDQYNSIDAQAKEAVDKYLATPSQYDEQAISGSVGGGGTDPVTGSAPPDLTNNIRADAVAWARWMYENRKYVYYMFGGGHGMGPDDTFKSTYPNMDYSKIPTSYPTAKRTTPPALPLFLDCSSSTSLCLMWAGAQQAGVQATGGMMGFTKISRQDCGPGDLVIYGSASKTTHVAMVLERKGDKLICFSHGGGTVEDGADPMASPKIVDNDDYRTDIVAYVRWPGLK